MCVPAWVEVDLEFELASNQAHCLRANPMQALDIPRHNVPQSPLPNVPSWQRRLGTRLAHSEYALGAINDKEII